MKRHHLPGKGIRSGWWSQNKSSNWMAYHPAYSEMDRLLRRYERRLSRRESPLLIDQPPAPGWIHPLSAADVSAVLNRIPACFLHGLKGVLWCRGSHKQLRSISQVPFGCYDFHWNVIALFPFPKERSIEYARKPKPSHRLEYERHGAKWFKEDSGWRLTFTPEALRSFYLRDVLIHEVGHHVDHLTRRGHRSYQAHEGFAEWFATEFGLRRPGDRKPTPLTAWLDHN